MSDLTKQQYLGEEGIREIGNAIAKVRDGIPTNLIDDNSSVANKTWSSQKIAQMLPEASSIDILASDPVSPKIGYMWIVNS